jgi:hypothetical protein
VWRSIEEDEMGKACSMDENDCIQGFGGKGRKIETTRKAGG